MVYQQRLHDIATILFGLLIKTKTVLRKLTYFQRNLSVFDKIVTSWSKQFGHVWRLPKIVLDNVATSSHIGLRMTDDTIVGLNKQLNLNLKDK